MTYDKRRTSGLYVLLCIILILFFLICSDQIRKNRIKENVIPLPTTTYDGPTKINVSPLPTTIYEEPPKMDRIPCSLIEEEEKMDSKSRKRRFRKLRR